MRLTWVIIMRNYLFPVACVKAVSIDVGGYTGSMALGIGSQMLVILP